MNSVLRFVVEGMWGTIALVIVGTTKTVVGLREVSVDSVVANIVGFAVSEALVNVLALLTGVEVCTSAPFASVATAVLASVTLDSAIRLVRAESAVSAFTSEAFLGLVLSLNTVETIKTVEFGISFEVTAALDSTKILLVATLVLVENRDASDITEVINATMLEGWDLEVMVKSLTWVAFVGSEALAHIELNVAETLSSIETLE